MRGHILIVMAMSLILATSSQAQAGIVAFGGQYEDQHRVNLNETNHVKLVFSTMIYRDNSTLQFKIMATPANALYLDAEGKQNHTWGVHLTIFDGNQVKISHALTNVLSLAILTENEKKYGIEIDITIPQDIPHGTYTLIFMALSNEYYSEGQAQDATQGIIGGAKITESLSIKHYVEVGRWPVETETETQNHLNLLLQDIMLLVIGLVFIYFLTRLTIKQLKRLKHEN